LQKRLTRGSSPIAFTEIREIADLAEVSEEYELSEEYEPTV